MTLYAITSLKCNKIQIAAFTSMKKCSHPTDTVLDTADKALTDI